MAGLLERGGTLLPSLPTLRLPLDARLAGNTCSEAEPGLDSRSWGLLDTG